MRRERKDVSSLATRQKLQILLNIESSIGEEALSLVTALG